MLSWILLAWSEVYWAGRLDALDAAKRVVVVLEETHVQISHSWLWWLLSWVGMRPPSEASGLSIVRGAISGQASSLQDPETGLTVPRALKLDATCEMYQWVEKTSKASRPADGQSSTTHSYAKSWATTPPAASTSFSSRFATSKYMNPVGKTSGAFSKLGKRSWKGTEDIKVAGHSLEDSEAVDQIIESSMKPVPAGSSTEFGDMPLQLPLPVQGEAIIDEAGMLRREHLDRATARNGEELFTTVPLGRFPAPGDVRLLYRAAAPTEAIVIGRVDTTTGRVGPWTAPNGHDVILAAGWYDSTASPPSAVDLVSKAISTASFWKAAGAFLCLLLAGVAGSCAGKLAPEEEEEAARGGAVLTGYLGRLSGDGQRLAGAVTAVASAMIVWATVSAVLLPSVESAANSGLALMGCVLVLYGLPNIFNATSEDSSRFSRHVHRHAVDGGDSEPGNTDGEAPSEDPAPVATDDDDRDMNGQRMRRR